MDISRNQDDTLEIIDGCFTYNRGCNAISATVPEVQPLNYPLMRLTMR